MQVAGGVKYLFTWKFILVIEHPVTGAGEGGHRTVRNSSKMKLGTCASATWNIKQKLISIVADGIRFYIGELSGDVCWRKVKRWSEPRDTGESGNSPSVAGLVLVSPYCSPQWNTSGKARGLHKQAWLPKALGPRSMLMGQ